MKRRTHRPRQRKGRNAAAPYTKYNKKPHTYSPAYYAWRDKIKRRSGAH